MIGKNFQWLEKRLGLSNDWNNLSALFQRLENFFVAIYGNKRTKRETKEMAPDGNMRMRKNQWYNVLESPKIPVTRLPSLFSLDFHPVSGQTPLAGVPRRRTPSKPRSPHMKTPTAILSAILALAGILQGIGAGK